MMRFSRFLSVALALTTGVGLWAAPALALLAEAAPAHPQQPRLDAVFKSLKESTAGGDLDIHPVPLLLAVTAIVMMTIALKQWNRRKAKPRSLNNHRRLINEAARAAGVSKRQLKRLTPLATAGGLSSPLVAMICPSALKGLAQNVQSAEQQEVIRSLAKGLVETQTRRRAS